MGAACVVCFGADDLELGAPCVLIGCCGTTAPMDAADVPCGFAALTSPNDDPTTPNWGSAQQSKSRPSRSAR